MKVIVIKDEDVDALLTELELSEMQSLNAVDSENTIRKSVYRRVNYVLVKWAQGHGYRSTK